MSGTYQKYAPQIWESWKKTAGHNNPHMASKNKVLPQKCPPRTKNYDYGVIVAWDFFSAEISGRAQESAISALLC